MEQTTLDRIGAASGVPAVVLSPVGFSLIASSGFGDGSEMSTEQAAEAIARASGSLVYAGALLDVLGGVFFLVFAARVHRLLRRAEGDAGWLSTVVFGAALLALAGSSINKAAFLALGAGLGRGLDPAEAVTLLDTSRGSFLLAQLFLGGVFLGAVAVAALRTRVLPGWLAWPGAVVAVANLLAVALPPEAGFPPFALFILWTLVASGYLTARPAGVVSRSR